MRKFRLLPTVIIFAGLTLTVKLGALWQDMEFAFFAPAIAESKAAPEKQEAKAGDDAKAQGQDKNSKKSENQKLAKAVDEKAKPDDGTPSESDKGAKSETKDEKGFDPALATDAEVEVLQKLAKRRDELNRRARNIDLRETMLVATERRVKVKITELKKLQEIVQKLLKKHDGEQETKYLSLVKIYESMKPKDAARIFEHLDMKVLLNVVERMREARTGPILAKMAPVKAKALTMALAERRNLPALAKK